MPFVTMTVNPGNYISRCMMSHESMGEIESKTLQNPAFKTLRSNMLNGVWDKEGCKVCYKRENANLDSQRLKWLKNEKKYLDEDGLYEKNINLSRNKIYHLYLNFSNICNFKCRTCGGEFSSQWAQEEKQHDNRENSFRVVQHADESGKLLDEILEQIPNMELAYFAGGEPLITDEHYTILEEMINTGACKKIVLRYNTNMSNFKYKKYDILDMWSNFKNVEVSASIDHFGEKAEYIRSGTRWHSVENNLREIRDVDFINYQFNCVLSNLNYVTLGDFFTYMIDQDLLRKHDYISIYHLLNPSFYSAQNLPELHKEKGTLGLLKLLTQIRDEFWCAQHVENAVKFATSANTWNEHGKEFIHNTVRRDKIRNESFTETFPELADLIDG